MRGCCLLGCALALTTVSPVPVYCQAAHTRAPKHIPLEARIAAITQEAAVARAHWGISVTRLDGTPVLGINDGQYFMPASNAKLFTTAAAMALLPMEARLKTNVIATGYLRQGGLLEGKLVLRGAGDANLSGRPVPYQPRIADQPASARDELRYIDELADAIKQGGITRITGDVVGDDSLFPWDPYPADWAIDDTPWYYGAPINALMIADNAVTLTITPGRGENATPDEPANAAPVQASFSPALPYYTLDVQATTAPKGSATRLDIQRGMNERTVHIYGTIAADAKPYVQEMSIADPAEYAAIALKAALEERGIPVSGRALARHGNNYFEPSFTATSMRPADLAMDPLQPNAHTLAQASAEDCASCGKGWISRTVAEHTSQPWYDDIVVTNKVSQNQHAEVFLRQLGLLYGTGATTIGGARVVRTFLTSRVGIDPQDFVFYDGSGLSGHDLVTPRAATRLLSYATTQPWGAKWKASLPIAGVDGSLRSRFPDPPLQGHIFAKTGTLGEARALSGYVECASGQTLAFSVMVSTHTPLNNEDSKALDRIVAAIAAAE